MGTGDGGRGRSAARLIVLALAIAAAGATAFGLWHVAVGGLLHGNPRAAGFGVVLAAVAGAVLAGLLLVWRRRLRGR